LTLPPPFNYVNLKAAPARWTLEFFILRKVATMYTLQPTFNRAVLPTRLPAVGSLCRPRGAVRLLIRLGMVLAAIAGYTIPVGNPARLARAASTPRIALATYLGYHGGSGDDAANGMKVDATGHIYIVGTTSSGLSHKATFVAKFDPSGTKLLYSTRLHSSCDAQGADIALDGVGNAYITGLYTGKDTYGICDVTQVEVAKLGPTGVPLYDAHVGGLGGFDAKDWGNGIAVDRRGNAYVTGQIDSDDSFPTTAGAFMTKGPGYVHTDGFVLKVDGTGKLVYSTVLGGTDLDHGTAIAVDSTGDAYVTGQTSSIDFPTTANAYEPHWISPHGLVGAFLTVLNPTGSALIYSTYLSGNTAEEGVGIAVDRQGDAYLAGATDSSNFPTTPNAYSRSCGGDGHCGLSLADKGGCTINCTFFDDAFVAEINPRLRARAGLVYATYLGGALGDDPSGIAVDSAGHAYIAGSSSSTDFPIMAATQSARGDAANPLNPNTDAFVAELNLRGAGRSALLFSTYLGGKADDRASALALGPAGSLYVAGTTNSPDFPTVAPLQGRIGGGSDAFLVIFTIKG
jgi:hypothetical protein